MGNSLLMGGAKLGMDVRLVGPKDRGRSRAGHEAHAIARQGRSMTLTDSSPKASRAWTHLHRRVGLDGRAPGGLDRPHQAAHAVPNQFEGMTATGNPDTWFMHCLPAFHGARDQGRRGDARDFGIAEMEVTDEVFESPASIVFDQAENRMHTIKAVLVATIGD